MGITYSELLDLDIRKFNCLVDGYQKRRETNMNDQLAVGHRIAGKIAQAVWGSKGFSKPIKQFDFTQEENTVASRNEKVFRTLKAKGLI